MFVELILADGIGRSQVLRCKITQAVVYQDNGTPIAVAGEFGPDGSQLAAVAGNHDFQSILKKLGVERTVIVDTLKLPKPPVGAKLLPGSIMQG